MVTESFKTDSWKSITQNRTFRVVSTRFVFVLLHIKTSTCIQEKFPCFHHDIIATVIAINIKIIHGKFTIVGLVIRYRKTRISRVTLKILLSSIGSKPLLTSCIGLGLECHMHFCSEAMSESSQSREENKHLKHFS